MRNAELIAVAYFAYVAIAAWLVPRVRAKRRIAVSLVAVAIVAGIWIFERTLAPTLPPLVSAWIPIAWLLFGYWLPAGLWRAPMPRAETWLRASDRWLSRAPFNRLHGATAPSLWLRLLEAAYLLVHVMVPAGLLVMMAVSRALGTARAADLFWTPILLAGYACYGTLPWLQTRPPRELGSPPLDPHRSHSQPHEHAHAHPHANPHADPADATDARSALRRLNIRVLDRLSVHANTFPSGHSAVALAIALYVLHVAPIAGLSPALGPAFLGLAALIALATVLCRYHYTADTLLGVALGLIAWLAARALLA